jgi:hypothetical protein
VFTIIIPLRFPHRSVRRFRPMYHLYTRHDQPRDLVLFHAPAVSGPCTPAMIILPVWTGPGRVGAVVQ